MIYKPTSISQSQIIENQSNLNKKEENENYEFPLITKINDENNNGDLEQWKNFILTSLEIVNDISEIINNQYVIVRNTFYIGIFL